MSVTDDWCRFVTSAVEQSFEGIAFADMDRKLIYVNPAWAEMHGYHSPTELIGEKISIFHNREQMEQCVKPFIDVVFKKGQNSGEVGHIRKDGTPFTTLMTTTLLKDEQEKPTAILGIALDITKRIQMKESLRAEKRKLAESQRIAQIGSWEHNLVTDETLWSDEMYRLFGLDPMSDSNNIELFLSLLHPDDRPSVEKVIKKIRKIKCLKEPLGVEYRIIRKDGAVRTLQAWIEFGPDACVTNQILFGTVQDITERRQIEEALQQSHQHLEELVQKRTAELEQKSHHLEELNTALKVFLQQQERDKKEIEKRFMENLEKLVFPYLGKLKEATAETKCQVFVEIVDANLREIISPFALDLLGELSKLTPAEIKIAELIRQGKPTKEIAEVLSLSPATIATHRQNIRKKLALTNKKMNLRSILTASTN
jgi:PAS domain S-box-containing protein